MFLNSAIREVQIISYIFEIVGNKRDKKKLTPEQHHEEEKSFIEKFNKFYDMNKKFEVSSGDTTIHMDWSEYAKAQYVECIGTEKVGIHAYC